MVKGMPKSFWKHFGTPGEEFFDHFRVLLNSEIVLEAFWELCWGGKSLFRVLTRPFWKVLDTFWRGFWRQFGVFFRWSIQYEFLLNFDKIFYGLWYYAHKQNLAKSMEGIAKMKAHGCSILNPFENGEWKDFRKEFEIILGPGWHSEAYSKAMLVKYYFLKGPESIGVNWLPSPPPKIGGFWSPVGGIREGLTRRDTPTGSAD